MSNRINKHTRLIIRILNSKNIPHRIIDENVGIIQIGDLKCKVAAPRVNSYKINVNLDWFKEKDNFSRPKYKRYKLEVDCYLFLKDQNILFLNNKELRSFAFELENNTAYWQNENQSWGLSIKKRAGLYFCHWIENSKKFPIKILGSVNDLQNKVSKDYTQFTALKNLVEQGAVDETIKYYRSMGFKISSVENENKGWDLEASNQNTFYRIEVKGRSGSNIDVELTPNEYESFKNYQSTFRLCVVTNVLSQNPTLTEFYYDNNQKCWINSDGKILNIKEKISAKMYS